MLSWNSGFSQSPRFNQPLSHVIHFRGSCYFLIDPSPGIVPRGGSQIATEVDMKSYLGFCLLIFFATSVQGVEHPPEFPKSADEVARLLEKRWSQAGMETCCVSKSASDSDEQNTFFESAGYSSATEARIGYLFSYLNEEEWMLKSASEIQLYPPPENGLDLIIWHGCILFNR
jgi:hypothetical protein